MERMRTSEFAGAPSVEDIAQAYGALSLVLHPIVDMEPVLLPRLRQLFPLHDHRQPQEAPHFASILEQDFCLPPFPLNL